MFQTAVLLLTRIIFILVITTAVIYVFFCRFANISIRHLLLDFHITAYCHRGRRNIYIQHGKVWDPNMCSLYTTGCLYVVRGSVRIEVAILRYYLLYSSTTNTDEVVKRDFIFSLYSFLHFTVFWYSSIYLDSFFSSIRLASTLKLTVGIGRPIEWIPSSPENLLLALINVFIYNLTT